MTARNEGPGLGVFIFLPIEINSLKVRFLAQNRRIEEGLCLIYHRHRVRISCSGTDRWQDGV
jgi:hypothetical protein